MNQANPTGRVPRRTILKWFAAAALVQSCARVQSPAVGISGSDQVPPPPPSSGYGTDPKLNAIYEPGAFWQLTLTPAQRLAATALADLILPADHFGPSASTLRVPDFIDEWVSAPYPNQLADRAVILPGLDWLDVHARALHGQPFAQLDPAPQGAIADGICDIATAKPEAAKAAAFFAAFRSLAASAYYATEPGWSAIGYVGNVPMGVFAGPPAQVLAQLGVEQTVK